MFSRHETITAQHTDKPRTRYLSRLNQRSSSIIQKKVVTPNDFASPQQLPETPVAFTDRHDKTAAPFNWKMTAADLASLLHRISEHQHPLPPTRQSSRRPPIPDELTVAPT
jgi:hypothetical protein